jgi:xylan 1,4-beta-xylosidase
MKKIIVLIITIILSIVSCSSENLENEKTFTNPILAGYYPDPSICRVDNEYYLVNSTFAHFPGIPIFHSKDLVNWELIGHAIDRAEQMDFEGLGVSRGIFAPSISYKNGIFYIACTLVDGGGNFIVTSEKPEGPYSNSVWLPEINGIDPSPYFDDDGKAYMLFNSNAPNNEELYVGHKTIRMLEFDYINLKVTGEEKILINGGSDLSKEPIWIEGPHIYKKDGYYYLMAAEGGTADDHSEVIFRSKNIDGPYESYKNNPILTQRHLDPKRDFPITSTGHADLIETQSGEWWAIFLGCRPYAPFEKGFYNTGRETFLAPVKWIEDPDTPGAVWPIINPDFEEIQYVYNYPKTNGSKLENSTPYSGNFKTKYEFDSDSLHKNFIYLRTPKEKWYNLKERPGYLKIDLREETCAGKSNPSFIGHRQQHLNCSASTSIKFNPSAENEKAGLIIFLSETRYYYLCKSIDKGEAVIQLYKSINQENSENKMELITSTKITKEQVDKKLNFKIKAEGKYYSFLYSFDDHEWVTLKQNMDATYLRAVIPKDFVGCVYAMYATSLGITSSNSAYFDWFKYKGDDEVYK